MLPGIAPQHTRASFGSASRLYVENFVETADDFIVDDETGLWLLPEAVAERDLSKGEVILGQLAIMQTEAGLARQAGVAQTGARILGRTMLTKTGCMVDGLKHNQDASRWVHRLAELEQGTFLLDREEDIPQLKVCSTDDCINTRHYDLDYGRMTLQERRMELNPHYYRSQEDGTLQTVWGDSMPSVEESLKYFIEFQKMNFPFVPFDRSPLTPSGISQVRFQPQTGCWEAWSYYCKPEEGLNWQFDGYGRLYMRETMTEVNPQSGEIMRRQRRGHWLAHRVTWTASGRDLEKGKVLNHLCNYRRCCNPLHLEQVSVAENNEHGYVVKRARRQLFDESPEVESYTSSVEELAPYYQNAREMYHRLAS